MEAVEARRHEEGRGVDALAEAESGVAVFISLDAGEPDAKQDGEPKPQQRRGTIALAQGMVRPGHRHPGGEQDERVEQRQLERIEGVDGLGRPYAAYGRSWE